MARNSRALICSRLPVHFQPVTIRHFHNVDGTLALSRWYRTICDDGVEIIMSSPLIDTRFEILKDRSDIPSCVASGRVERQAHQPALRELMATRSERI